MTTPLKDSCPKHSQVFVKCAVEWGPQHVWGFHRQETGVESESPRPSSGGLWGLWCWGPHWSRRARRARNRKVAKPCKSDRSCIALKEALGSVSSSSCQFIPSPPVSHHHSWYSLRRIVEALDASTASSSVLSIGAISATARLM